MEKRKSLPAEIASKYSMLKGHGVGEYYYKGHNVHLDKISLEYADQLVLQGFPYLVEKKAAPPKKAQTSKP